jgi:putative nucleotidyltransferase with HDIG domain
VAKKHRVLVIDDNKWVRDTLEDLLSTSGYSVGSADNGATGLNLIKTESFDVVLADIKMPRMDGIELLKRIRDCNPSLPVVMITGFPTVDYAIQSLREGAADFITKPFRYEQVCMILDKLLKDKNGVKKSIRRNIKSPNEKTVESLNQRLNKKVKELALLYSISESMNVSHISSEFLFNTMVRVATELVEAECAAVLVLDRDANELIVKAVKGGSVDWRVNSIVPINEEIPWKDVVQGKYLIINGKGDVRRKFYKEKPHTSNTSVFIPLTIKDNVFGVLSVGGKLKQGRFNQSDVKLLQALVRKASLNIENTFLYESMYSNLISTVQSLVAAIEARDSYTQQHSQRVTQLSVKIAEEMGCSQHEIDTIKFAGILHDIGKISIRDSILLKRGKLTCEEMKMIKTHPLVGEKILQPLGLLPAERAIVRHHHERWDGSGYPDGLTGNEIPLLARIISVADSYDAMTSDRPYREAKNNENALKELMSCSGTQFDEDVVNSFQKLCFSQSFLCISQ